MPILKVKPFPSAPPPPPPKAQPKPKPPDPKDQRPHSVEAEKGILGSIMVHCQFEHSFGVLSEVAGSITPWYFYVPANKSIYELMLSLYKDNTQIDLITFTQILRDRGLLDQVGGPAYIAELSSFVPSAVNIQYYVDILRDKFILRETIDAGTRIVRAAYGAQDDAASDLLADFSLKIDRIKQNAGWANGVKPLASGDLLEMKGKLDPNNLVGARWQCRGGNCLWSGGAGYGKSTLITQFGVNWAAGLRCFGVKPIRPLKSLIIQSENDDFDVSEQYNGVISGIELDDEARATVNRNVIFVRVEAKSGRSFLTELERLLNIMHPDLCWIDPLFAFAGCDLMDSAKTGCFLREGLFPLFVKFMCCGNIIHHIAKPPREEKADKPVIDYQYAAFGSSEIQNAFRAVNTLHPINFADQIYKLVFSKRGRRARAKTLDGSLTSQIYIQQSDDPNCMLWTQVEEPEKPSKKANALKYTEENILEYMSVANGWKVSKLQKHIKAEAGMQSSTFYLLWSKLKIDGKLRCNDDNEWFKMGFTPPTPN